MDEQLLQNTYTKSVSLVQNPITQKHLQRPLTEAYSYL